MINQELNKLFTSVPENFTDTSVILARSKENPKNIFFVKSKKWIIVNGIIYSSNESLTYDNAATADSSNLLTSGTIYNELQNLDVDVVKQLTEYLDSSAVLVGDTHDEAISKLVKIIKDNEYVVATALNELNDEKADKDDIPTKLSDLTNDVDYIRDPIYVHTDNNFTDEDKIKLDNIEGTLDFDIIHDITTYEDSSDILIGDSHDQAFSKLIKIIENDEYVTAAAINDLNDKKLDTSAVLELLEPYVNDAAYDSSTKRIYFKHDDTVISSIDATDFIKDGMVNNVVIADSSLIISFNTDAGLEDIELSLSEIFDPDNYYTKSEIDSSFVHIEDFLFDEFATQGSSNLLTSGVIFNELALKENVWKIVDVSLDGTIGEYVFINNSDDYISYNNDYNTVVHASQMSTELTQKYNLYYLISKNIGTATGNTRNASYIFYNPYTETDNIIRIEYSKDNTNISKTIFHETKSQLITNIEYIDLLSRYNNQSLIPGMLYRITDYVTTTAQLYTSANGHQFDIIVQALNTNTLDENARAIWHYYDDPETEDVYFNDCNLPAWELKYTIENKNIFSWADSAHGKGVIYYMKDEWGNEASYDFKSIMFKRKLDDNAILDNTLGEDKYVYTFTWIDDNFNIYDATIRGNIGDILTDINEYIGTRDNKISMYTDLSHKYALNNIVFISSAFFDTGSFYGIAGNKFGTDCYNFTFGDYCNYNTFGDYCYDNTFGISCSENTFGNSCTDNTFGSSYSENTFSNNCHNNTFGNNCHNNIFDDHCYNNTFGDYCDYNTFGNNCYNNTFGDYCNSNTFGNSCINNTFGNNYYDNTFGNNCNYIKYITNNVSTNINNYFGNNIIENNNKYIFINSSLLSPMDRPYMHNLKILQGTNITNTYVTIDVSVNTNLKYAGRNSNNDIVIWNPADHVLPNI